MKKLLMFVGLLAGISQVAFTQNNIGIGYGLNTPLYQTKTNNHILPLVNLEYDRFFIKGSSSYGMSLGFDAIKDDRYKLSFYSMPLGGYKLKSKDMKDGYKGIDTRETTLMGGIGFDYYTDFYDVVASVSAEVGSRGGHLNLRVSKPYYISPELTIVPTATFVRYNSKFVDYYFGVEENELNNEKITETYDGSSGYRYGVGVLGNYKFTDSVALTAFAGVSKFSNEIKKSPIVKKDVIGMFGTGVVYTF